MAQHAVAEAPSHGHQHLSRATRYHHGMSLAIEALRPHVGTRKKIHIERSRTRNPRLNGYLVALSDCLGMLHAFDDFEPDGYTIFRADVLSVESGSHERHWDRMLAGEGLLGALDREIAVDLTDLHSAITSLDSTFGRLIVECEDAESDLEDFYIGTVVRLSQRSLWFEHFDGLGVWASEPSEILLDEITLLQVETPYMERFWRYIDPRPAR